jgi:hypothetical protein
MLMMTVLHRNRAGLPSRAEGDTRACGTVLASSGRHNSLPIGMIVDGAFDQDWLTSVEEIRCSLPLDSKRPTVDRRFFADDSEGRTIVSAIEAKVKEAIMNAQALFVLEKQDHDSELFVYCNKYLRILEYTNPGSGLPPHTDGRKVCELSGATSTHTFLLFLSECSKGGETVLLDGKHGWTSHSNVVVPPERVVPNDLNGHQGVPLLLRDMTDGDTSTNVSLGVSPHVGRILFFPHEWPHAGAICETVPKVILRAELTIAWMQKTAKY